MNAQKYFPVNQQDSGGTSQINTKSRVNGTRATEIWLKIRSKIEALVWVAVFLFTYQKTQFFKQIFTNPKINQLFLIIFLLACGLNFSIIVFVSLILPNWGFKNYEDYSTYITPLGSIVMVIGFFSCIIAVYPVYGAWSLLIVPSLGMGFMMISQFIPFKGNLNSLVLFLLFGGFLGYSYYFHE